MNIDEKIPQKKAESMCNILWMYFYSLVFYSMELIPLNTWVDNYIYKINYLISAFFLGFTVAFLFYHSIGKKLE